MISFILPAHNEEALLPAALEAIHAAAKQAGRPYEILVADDASTDRTAVLAREHGARVISIQARQIATARSAGASIATGEYLFFIDADTRITSGALAEALIALDKGAAGGGGPMAFDPPVPRYVPVLFPPLQFLFRVFRLTGGAFLFCNRKAFDAAGGWDQTVYAGEEIAMAQALKKHGRFEIVRTPVITSGRKLRTHSPWEILAIIAKIALRGPRAVKSRDHLDLWYAPRREDQNSKAAQQQSSK
jgi:cellulose synthase/poly-beta-1,6-N-acetylglucosamine synthase-like glycosyltransferase